MNKPFRRLPDSELEVMQAVWSCTPPVSRTEIETHLHTTRPIALTTLLTLISRLAEKGFIRIEKTGRRAQYVPLVAESDYLAAQSKSFFEKLCGSNVSTFANALCDSGLSKEELTKLRDLLERDLL